MGETKFKVGDKVRVTKKECGHGFNIGDIIEVQEDRGYGVKCSNGSEHWSLTYEEVEKIEEKLIIHCSTQEDYNKIVDKIEWFDGDRSNRWLEYGEDTGLRIENGKIQSRGTMHGCYASGFEEHKRVTAKEYLGKEIDPSYKYGIDMGSTLNESAFSTVSTPSGENFFYPMWKQENNNLTGDSIVKKTMNSVVKFATDLTLSADEKALRKAGLKDSEGYYTDEAERIVANLEAKERGYKNEQEMSRTTGFGYDDIEFSVIELDTLFKKFEKNILEVAKKFNAENKCK